MRPAPITGGDGGSGTYRSSHAVPLRLTLPVLGTLTLVFVATPVPPTR